VALLLVAWTWTCAAATSPEPLPSAVAEKLTALQTYFPGSPDPADPRSMEGLIARFSADIEPVLAYGKQSSAAADAVAARLLGEIATFNNRFKPGSAIDEALLSKTVFVRGEIPWQGINVDAYLLLELARQTGSAARTKEALSAISDYGKACSYFFESSILHEQPDLAAEVAREKQETGGCGATPIAEAAWACESFMTQAYLTDAFASHPSAQAVVNEYWQWRKATIVEQGSGTWLPTRYQHTTLSYARKLADALPAG
jgi:hypothetical protein